MTSLSLRAAVAGASLAVSSIGPSSAQTVLPLGSSDRPEPVVVTATRSPLALSRVLADVTVLEREALERSGAVCVADVLARLPGIEIARNGGPMGVTSVFLRGSESRHTAVYLDGVRVDSQGTGGAIWEQLPLETIERIEVLRGPAATVYGSDAVAGVVQLFTKRGNGPAKGALAWSAGSARTTQAQGALSGSQGAWDYSVAAATGRSAGFNARPVSSQNPDRDGWERQSGMARLGWAPDRVHRLDAAVTLNALDTRYDQGRTADDWAYHRLNTASLSWQARWSPEATTRVHLGRSRSTYETQPSFYRTESELGNATLQHEQRLGAHTVSLLVEQRTDALFNPATAFSDDLRGRRHQNGTGLGWRADLGDHALQAQVRHDDDSEFGGKGTGGFAWGWTFAPQWLLRASAATSFRAPTLYQRFSEYGNAGLQPETGRNVEWGLRWSEGPHQLQLSQWNNRVQNLIGFGGAGACLSPFGCFVNVGRSRLAGVTLSGQTRLGATQLRASADLHDPRNLDLDKVLVRRARRLATLAADHVWGAWTFGTEVQAVGLRWDNAANTLPMGGFALVNLTAARSLTPEWRLELRADNVGDKAYELARGYANAGRTGLVTLRWTPR